MASRELKAVDKNEFARGVVRLLEEQVAGKTEKRQERIIPIEGYTVPEVALSLNVSDQFVWDLIWSGQLAYFRVGKNSRLVRITADSLKAFCSYQELVAETHKENANGK